MAFQIEHSWGDPREPSYKGTHKVLYVRYRDEGLALFFEAYPRVDETSNELVLSVEVPAGIRKALHGRWNERTEIYNRVSAHLLGLDLRETWPRVQHESLRIAFHESKVPSAASAWIERQQARWRKISGWFPTGAVAALLGMSLALILGVRFHVLQAHLRFVLLLAFALAVLSLIPLLLQVKRNFLATRYLFLLSWLSRTGGRADRGTWWNIQLSTIRAVCRTYWSRYVLSAASVALLTMLAGRTAATYAGLLNDGRENGVELVRRKLGPGCAFALNTVQSYAPGAGGHRSEIWATTTCRGRIVYRYDYWPAETFPNRRSPYEVTELQPFPKN